MSRLNYYILKEWVENRFFTHLEHGSYDKRDIRGWTGKRDTFDKRKYPYRLWKSEKPFLFKINIAH